MLEVINREQFKEWTASLSGGLILIVDNNNAKLTYEEVDTWNLQLAQLTDLRILHGPYSSEILKVTLKKFLEHESEFLIIVIYNEEIDDEKMFEQYKERLKILRDK